MSHLIRKADEEYRLYLAGEGTAHVAYAERAVDGGGGPEEWCVWPQGVAEHLDEFIVKNEDQALTVLKAIGLAYEAGGGGEG